MLNWSMLDNQLEILSLEARNELLGLCAVIFANF